MIPEELAQTELLCMLAEESNELGQAALKLRRAIDGSNPTPKSIDQCKQALIEEMADVMLCYSVVDLTLSEGFKAANQTKRQKYLRWMERLNERN